MSAPSLQGKRGSCRWIPPLLGSGEGDNAGTVTAPPFISTASHPCLLPGSWMRATAAGWEAGTVHSFHDCTTSMLGCWVLGGLCLHSGNTGMPGSRWAAPWCDSQLASCLPPSWWAREWAWGGTGSAEDAPALWASAVVALSSPSRAKAQPMQRRRRRLSMGHTMRETQTASRAKQETLSGPLGKQMLASADLKEEN